MCLYKTHRFPKISLKPITVYKYGYKLGENEYYTPFQWVCFKCGSVLRCRNSSALIAGTFHSEITSEGVHAYTIKPTVGKMPLYEDYERKWFSCIIPPLTPYWIGEGDVIAATKIIVKQLINL